MMDRDRELHDMADEGRALMSDYIERSEALSLVHHSKFDTEDDKNYILLILGKEYGCQSADVEPVVRCKDCKYNTIYEKGMWSEHHGCEVHNYKNIDINFEEYNPLFFCGCGERKDDDARRSNEYE